MTRIVAAILAGGHGERLGGVNKALIRIGGVRLIDRVVESLGTSVPVLLCAGAVPLPDDLSIARQRRIADLPTGYGGPLAGVAAAIAALDSTDAPDYLLTVAVDTPFFPPDFASRALTVIDDAAGVMGRYARQDYPTNVLWRFASIRGLPAQTRAGLAPASLKRLAQRLGVAFLDYTGDGSFNPFANVNTHADLAALERHAATHPQPPKSA